jgi:glutathione S-transferase
MSAPLKLYELTLSPNNVKVRIALGYKGLSYEREPMNLDAFPGDRTRLIELSRQPRTPVLEHGKTIIFDSNGILRYLDANFPDTPSLFSTDYATFGAIEQWELWARTTLGEPVGMMFSQVFNPDPDLDVCRQASGLFNDVTAKVEDQLSSTPFLMGDSLTAADLACAPIINLAMLPEAFAASNPIATAFHKNFHLGDGREKTRAWVHKLMAYDEAMQG